MKVWAELRNSSRNYRIMFTYACQIYAIQLVVSYITVVKNMHELWSQTDKESSTRFITSYKCDLQ